MKKALVLAAVFTILSGCATIFSGTKDNVTINSEPPGAKVKLNGMDIGRTPATFPLKRSSGSPIIEVEQKGFEKRVIMPQSQFNGVAIINLICPICWAVDAVTGAMWYYDPTYYTAELEPQERKDEVAKK